MPATRIAARSERYVAARPPLYHLTDLWIALTRCLNEVAEPTGSKHFGWSVRDHLICGAIYLGTTEGRLMTATKIAVYVGIPRSTVLRHLTLLEQRHLVKRCGNTWSTPEGLLMLRRQQDFKEIIQLVHSTAKRLP